MLFMFNGWPMPGVPETVAFGIGLTAMVVGVWREKPVISWRLLALAAFIRLVLVAALVSHNQRKRQITPTVRWALFDACVPCFRMTKTRSEIPQVETGENRAPRSRLCRAYLSPSGQSEHQAARAGPSRHLPFPHARCNPLPA